jgi:Peptidase family C25
MNMIQSFRNSIACLLLSGIAFFGGTESAFSQQGRLATVRAHQVSPQNELQGTFTPVWMDAVSVSPGNLENTVFQAPWFKDAQLDGKLVNLPLYEFKVEVKPTERLRIDDLTPSGVVEETTNLFTETIRNSGMQVNGWYPPSHIVLGERLILEGHHYQQVFIYPMLVNGQGNRLRKATAISYRLGKESNPGLHTAAQRVSWSSNSALATGDWYKIPVLTDGVYKLDEAWFESIGVDPSQIDPRTIRIHGGAQGMLTQVAGTRKWDDLPENAIQVQGESDATFDAADYVLFVGQSPHSWSYNDSLNRYNHRYNIYADTNYYFLTWGGANGKRITTQADAGAPTATPSSALHYQFYEKDIFNPLYSGRVWLGETFDLSTQQTFSFPANNLATGTNIDFLVRVGAQSDVSSNFTFKENGTSLATVSIGNTNSQASHSYIYKDTYTLFSMSSNQVTDGSIDLEMNYSKPLGTSEGYLDYIEMQYRQRLDLSGLSYSSLGFAEGVGSGELFDVNFQNGNTNFLAWDVTDPFNVNNRTYSLNGTTLNFQLAADSVKEIVVFTPNGGARVPGKAKKIATQNLHGIAQADYIIITHPEFKAAAERLAQFHRDEYDRTVSVVTTFEVYNEFNSGVQDVSAIRDFLKMVYDRTLNSRTPLRYAMMFGDGSYDYKRRVTQNESNFVPSYQSRKSEISVETFCSDDFYGFLDDGEGFWGEGASINNGATDILFYLEGDRYGIVNHGLDIGLGRMPVGSVEEAEYMVDKLIRYATSTTSFGAWRNKVLLVADHKDSDSNTHMVHSDSYTDNIYDSDPCINVDKIFMDNYDLVNTASGTRFPDGKEALLKKLDEGSLIVNYTGHGGEVGWSNSAILEIPDIIGMNNGDKMPVFVTATCEFGRWDDPARRSGAEMVLLKEEGGSIGMFTTVRVVYSTPNYTMNNNLYKFLLVSDSLSGRHNTLGETYYQAKNISWGTNQINNRNFTLLGDPAMVLSHPELKAAITSINGAAPQTTELDSLATLTLVTVSGEVQDIRGNRLSNYSGELNVTVFDKPTRFTTHRVPTNFYWQKNKLFVGLATVVNGQFSFQFVVPVDVSYDDGQAKISIYFQNGVNDGAGCYDNLYLGGTDSTSMSDDERPLVDLFMNDEKFVDGGMVGPDPTLVAELYDDLGINTVGTGVGHELTGVLDGDESNVIILNDYYTSKQDNYREGTIRYPFEDLAVGEHTLRVKVWDVANNSSQAEIRFLVASDANMALGHVLNYPNPFTTNTRFFIEHNKNGLTLDVVVKIYTVSGRLVKTLEDNFYAEGNLYCDLTWDGLDDYGDLIGRGVYVYQVIMRDQANGENVNRFEKLVLLR